MSGNAITSPRVVCLGGGHGLAATLTAIRSITSDITAIVTVADNGGSSGRLRKEFPIMPPGDLRMALTALCADDEWGRSWAEILQYRFTSEGELNGHPVGNLLLAALWDRDEDAVAGLDRIGALLKVVGRVLPMAAEPVDIEAVFSNNGEEKIVRGQVQVATASGTLQSVKLIPQEPPARAESIEAIENAELITMGPGSWFSSVLPHLLVPEIRSAITDSSARKILLLNLDAHTYQGLDSREFAGHSPLQHLLLLERYAPEIRFDYVVADESTSGLDELRSHLSTRGSELLLAQLRSENSPLHHDPEKLGQLFSHINREILVG